MSDVTIALPKRIRWWLWRRRFAIRWRSRVAWLYLVGRAIELHPDRLDGYDGEPPHFIRYDLIQHAGAAHAYLLDEWGYTKDEIAEPGTVDLVSMLHTPQVDDVDDERHSQYSVVPHGTPGAVRYWRVAE